MKTLQFTGLNENNVNNVINALAQLLADLQVHYTNLRNLHWNVKGPRFYVLHEKYEEMYNDVADKVDEVAERILQLNGTPEHRFSAYLNSAQVKELPVVKDEKTGLRYVLDTLKALIAQERTILTTASEAGDEVTVALMSDYLTGQEKTVWMLAAYNTEA
ncbi:MAG: Dps family protein [Prevotella sp.]